MREATEQLSYYDDPFSTQIFTRGNVASEDEVSFSFASGNSSHHSLLVLLSPTLPESDEQHVLRDSSSCSSADEPAGTKEGESRVRKISNLDRNTHVEEFSDDQAELMNHTPSESEDGDQVMERRLLSVDPVKDKGDVADKVEDNYFEQPKKPKRRERRHATASYLINPLQLPEQQLVESHLSNESKEDKGEGIRDDNVPPTPRRRKTYSMEDRLQNPLSMQLELENEFSTISKGDDDEPTPVSGSHVLKDSSPGDTQHHFDFDDALDMYPNPPSSPPASPGLPTSPNLPSELVRERERERESTLHVAASSCMSLCCRCTLAAGR